MSKLANNVGGSVGMGIRFPRPLIERVDKIVARRGFARHAILLHMIEDAVDRDEAAQRRLAREAGGGAGQPPAAEVTVSPGA